MKKNDTSLKPYFLVPLKVFQDKRLNLTLVCLYRYMVYKQGENDDAYPLIETICKDLNLSHATVSQGLNRLDKYGYLKILHKKDKRGRSRYIVETDFLKIQGVNNSQGLKTKPCFESESVKDPEDFINDETPYDNSSQDLEIKPTNVQKLNDQGLKIKPTLGQNTEDDSQPLQGVGDGQRIEIKPPKLTSKLTRKLPMVIKGPDDPDCQGEQPLETPDGSSFGICGSEADELTQIWLGMEHTSGKDMDYNEKFVKKTFRQLLRKQYSFDELKSVLRRYEDCGGKDPDFNHKFNIKSLLSGTVDRLLKEIADEADYYTENEEVI